MNSLSSAESASTELGKTDERRGSGELRLTRVEFRSTDGSLQAVIRSGKAIVIRLHYRAHEPIEHAHLGLRLSAEHGTLVTKVSTWYHGLDIPLRSPPGSAARGHIRDGRHA